MKQVTVTVLGSGSDGNSTIITYEDDDIRQSIIMDCGVVKESKMDLDWESLTGIYVTHSHSDHVSRINSVLKVCDVPVLMTKGEYDGTRYQNIVSSLTAYPQDVIFVTPREPSYNGVFKVTPLVSHHDTEQPVHYVIDVGGYKIFYGCDTVDLSIEVMEIMCYCDLVLIECNYDECAMETNVIDGNVIKEPYPDELKFRIQNSGHLSVQQIQKLFLLVNHPVYILTHISKTYNSPKNISNKLYATNGYYIACPEELPLKIIMSDIRGITKWQ